MTFPPFEREFVRSPEFQRLLFLKSEKKPIYGLAKHDISSNGYSEPIVLTDDDKMRGVYYQENQRTLYQQSKFSSYSEFLFSLEMAAEIKEFSSLYMERILQLINKTNQFNLTTKGIQSLKLKIKCPSPNYI